MPNQWARSAIYVLHGHKDIIDQRQTNGRDQLSMSLQGHKHLINQRQTNGRNQQSMSLHRHKHIIDQTQTNGRDLISYQSQLKAKSLGMILNLKTLLSRSNQYEVSISTNIFEVYML